MNILTFDIEEWLIYEQYRKGEKESYLSILRNYLISILNLLDSENIKATFFCLGIIAREYPEIIKLIDNNGHDIGCHSDSHTNLVKHTPESFQQETYKAIDSLQQVTGKKVSMYRAPAFSITENTKWAFEVLVSLDILLDCSVFPGKRGYGGFKDLDVDKPFKIATPKGILKEFPINYYPMNRLKVFYSGGGYFRMIPYELSKSFFRGSGYNMCYFHIRDFDKYQKKVYSLRYIKSYYGIKGAYRKFTKLIRDFNFVSLSQASEEINWSEAITFRPGN